MSDDLQVRFPEAFRSGPYLPVGVEGSARRVLIVALEHGSEDLDVLVEEILTLQLNQPDLKPVLLIGDTSNAALQGSGIAYESCLAQSELEESGIDISFADYQSSRLAEMVELYQPHGVLIAAPGTRLPAHLLL